MDPRRSTRGGTVSASHQPLSESRNGAVLRPRFFLALLCALALPLLIVRGAEAQQLRAVTEDLWIFPEEAIAWFAFDPRSLGEQVATDPNRAMVEAGLRNLIRHVCIVQDGGSFLPATLLSPGILGSAPYRLCLFDLAIAEPSGRPDPDRPIRLERLAAVLEWRSGEHHNEVLAALRSSLDEERRARRAGGGVEQSLSLPGGLTGVVYTQEGDPAWRTVSWCSTRDSLTVAVGDGALQRWMAARQARFPGPSEWYDHTRRVHSAGDPTDPVLLAFVNLNALRDALPEEFVYGRMGRLLKAWRLSNARAIMLHIRKARAPRPRPEEPPPVPDRWLRSWFTYSLRSESPGVVEAVAVSEKPSKETEAALDAGDAPYSLLIRFDPRALIQIAFDTYAALSPKAGAEAIAAQRRWLRSQGPMLDRLAPMLARQALIVGGSQSPAVTIPVQPRDRPERLLADMRQVWNSVGDPIRFDARSQTWTLRLAPGQADPDRLLSEFSWSLRATGDALIGVWSAQTKQAQPAR